MKKFLLVFINLFLMAAGWGALAQDTAVSMPALADLHDGWNRILPGGDTICARGGDYSFFVRPANSNKLMLYFQGGGACWDGLTCWESFRFPPGGNPVFKDSVGEDENLNPGYSSGILDTRSPENPLADYNVVFIPYCTGDVHTGSRIVTYITPGGAEYTVAHMGFVNASAALDWTYANFDAPSQVFITGSSAGAYGAIFHAPYILKHYEAVDAVVLGDAGVGITAAGWEGLAAWGLFDNLPAFIPELTAQDYHINLQYKAAANAFPNAGFAQFTTAADSVQVLFYMLQGGGMTFDEGSAAWSKNMEASLTELNQTLPNFRSYVAGGSIHTILLRPEFYTYQTDGIRFRDWLADLLVGKAVSSVTCTDCAVPEYAGQ